MLTFCAVRGVHVLGLKTERASVYYLLLLASLVIRIVKVIRVRIFIFSGPIGLLGLGFLGL